MFVIIFRCDDLIAFYDFDKDFQHVKEIRSGKRFCFGERGSYSAVKNMSDGAFAMLEIRHVKELRTDFCQRIGVFQAQSADQERNQQKQTVFHFHQECIFCFFRMSHIRSESFK